MADELVVVQVGDYSHRVDVPVRDALRLACQRIRERLQAEVVGAVSGRGAGGGGGGEGSPAGALVAGAADAASVRAVLPLVAPEHFLAVVHAPTTQPRLLLPYTVTLVRKTKKASEKQKEISGKNAPFSITFLKAAPKTAFLCV